MGGPNDRPKYTMTITMGTAKMGPVIAGNHNINIRILQAMVSGMPLVLGLRTRM